MPRVGYKSVTISDEDDKRLSVIKGVNGKSHSSIVSDLIARAYRRFLKCKTKKN